jgi:OPA family glycerol-3-phosphate transporter-like MFS transporter
MIGFLKSAPSIDRLPPDQIKPEYRRLRRQVFAGIFVGYAAYYLVRNTLALAIPDILKLHPEYSKAALGTALTGLSIAYGLSKFLMGSVSDRSNPRHFLPLGLLLSASIIAACGLVKGIYASLTVLIILQTLNGWVQGMGWPACGKTMVHWFSTKERGTIVSVWNTAHNVGGGLVANLAGLGVLLFGDWGAKFYFNAALAAGLAIVAFVLMRDTPQSCGLPPIERHRNDYPPDYSDAHERNFTFRQIFLEHVLNNRYLWAIAIANAFIYFVRYGVVNWIPTYLETHKHF